MKQPTREEYELAAKAAGLTTNHKWNDERLSLAPPVQALVVYRDGKLISTGWQPLVDDGDSRRLQNACGIDMFWWHDTIEAQIPIKEDEFGVRQSLASYADHNNDKCEAARHAVFFLAVEIGRAMP
jgi:hypothetical protein